MRVKNLINSKVGTVVDPRSAGVARVGVRYDEDGGTNTVYYVLKIFLEVLE